MLRVWYASDTFPIPHNPLMTEVCHCKCFFRCGRCKMCHLFSTICPSDASKGEIHYRVRRCVSQCITLSHPPRAGFPRSIARQPRGCRHRKINRRIAHGGMLPMPTFFAPNTIPTVATGEISSTKTIIKKSAQVGVIRTVVYGKKSCSSTGDTKSCQVYIPDTYILAYTLPGTLLSQ